MPAVVAFGRRWACGTDDFVFPGLLDTTVKSCWLLSALLVYYQVDLDSFENGDQFKAYMLGMMASLVIIILTDLLAVKRSSTGSIMDTHLRTLIVPLIYLRLFWEALDTGWNTLGTLWVFGTTFSTLQTHDPSSFYFIRRYIICNWVSLIVLALYFAFLYDPMGKLGEDSEQTYADAQSQFWAKKLEKYNYVLNWNFPRADGDDQVFQAVGKIFSSVLKETNFVSSDAVGGLFALYRLEEDRSSLSRGERRKESDSQVQVPSVEKAELLVSSSIIDDILKMEKYFPCTSGEGNWAKDLHHAHHHRLSKLWNSAGMGGDYVMRPSNPQFEANGFCSFCKMSSFLTSLGASGITETEIVHISLARSYKEVPFCIFLDHKSKSIVLTVVGSFSAMTILTYMDSLSLPLTTPELSSNPGAQHGLHRVSANLREKSISVLKTLTKSHPDHTVVLIGQSFGAGVAAFLGISLITEFPGLRILCLNPPGGLLSTGTAKFSESFTTTITFGNDLFSRISIPALLSLKQSVVDVIYKCKTPKYKLLLGVLLRLIGFKLKIDVSPVVVHEPSSNGYVNQAHSVTVTVPESPSKRSSPEEWNARKFGATDNTNRAYMPGKILHINKNPSFNPEVMTQKEYRIQWKDPSYFSKINLLPGLLSDHWNSQDKIINALNEYQKA